MMNSLPTIGKFLPAVAALLVISFPGVDAHAAVQSIMAEHTYVLGDNDTKSRARRYCLLNAQRTALEKAGSYVEVRTELENFALTADEVRSFSAALLRVEVVEEEYFVKDGNFAVRCKVKVDVDPESIGAELSEIVDDPAALTEMRANRRQVRELEDRAFDLQKRINRIDPGASLSLQSEQFRVLETLEEIREEKARIQERADLITTAALETVEPGMSIEEVVRLLGPPSARQVNTESVAGYECLNFGRLWVVFREGLASCMRDRLVYSQRHRGLCHCAGFAGGVVK